MKKAFFILVFLLVPILARATVTNQTTSVSFTCTGSTGPYPFTFPISDPTAMSVIQAGTTLGSTAYTITPVNRNYSNGGSVTLNSACSTGTLVLQRNTPLTQQTVYVNNMPTPFTSIGNSLDKLTEIDQDISGKTVACPFPQFLTQFSIGGTSVCALPPTIPVSSGLGNGTNVIDVTAVSPPSSTDACTAINAAISTYPNKLFYHAEGLTSATACSATVTIPDKATLFWPKAAIILTACPAVIVGDHSSLIGPVQVADGASYIFDQAGTCPGSIIKYATTKSGGLVQNMTVFGYDGTLPNGTGSYLNGQIAYDMTGCVQGCKAWEDNALNVQYAFKVSGYYQQVRDPIFGNSKYGIWCGVSVSAAGLSACASNRFFNHVLNSGTTMFPYFISGFKNVFDDLDVENTNIPITNAASFSQAANLATVTFANHGLNNGMWVSLISTAHGTISSGCQVSVVDLNTFTCNVGAGTTSGADMTINASTVYTFDGQQNIVNAEYVEASGLLGYVSDLTAVQITNVSKSGSTITYTTASGFPGAFFPTTYSSTPTAGGTGYTSADVGVMFNTACGSEGYISAVVGGAVTRVYTAGDGSGVGTYSCSTGTGQATTGGHGTGFTVNITAVSNQTVQIENNQLPNGGTNWDYTCNGIFTGTVTGANTFTVTNSNCSTFTPPFVAGLGPFVSALIPRGNTFNGGTAMTSAIDAGIDDLTVNGWYQNSATRTPYPTVINATKLALFGVNPFTPGNGPYFEQGSDTSSIECRNATGNALCALKVGTITGTPANGLGNGTTVLDCSTYSTLALCAAALPTSAIPNSGGSYQTGELILPYKSGGYTVASPITISSFVKIVGKGMLPVSINCPSSAACFTVFDSPFTVGESDGGFYNVQLVGNGSSGQTGIVAQDIIGLALENVVISGFSGTSSVGITELNANYWTERNHFSKVWFDNNTTNIWLHGASTYNSFGHQSWEDLHFNLGNNQVAISIDGNGFLYSSFISGVINSVYTSGTVPSVFNVAGTASVGPSVYLLLHGDVVSGTLNPATVVSGASFIPSGQFDGWNGTFQGSGTALAYILSTPGALSGTTSAIGGSALTLGQNTSGTVTIVGASRAVSFGAVINVTPVTQGAPGSGFIVQGWLTGTDTVTVYVECLVAGTPTSTTYNVKVVQ